MAEPWLGDDVNSGKATTVLHPPVFLMLNACTLEIHSLGHGRNVTITRTSDIYGACLDLGGVDLSKGCHGRARNRLFADATDNQELWPM